MGWRVEHSALHAASRSIISSAMAKPTKQRYPRSSLEDYHAARWEQLDLEHDIDVKLAAKIADDDIGAVLVCIGAKKTLKSLQFRRCDWVVGHGLEPLRGSVVLEEFNYCEAYYGGIFNSSISEAAVVPILQSIIDTDGNHLRKV